MGLNVLFRSLKSAFSRNFLCNASVQSPLYWGYKPFVVALQAVCSVCTSRL